jgi:hypothetical protein
MRTAAHAYSAWGGLQPTLYGAGFAGSPQNMQYLPLAQCGRSASSAHNLTIRLACKCCLLQGPMPAKLYSAQELLTLAAAGSACVAGAKHARVTAAGA